MTPTSTISLRDPFRLIEPELFELEDDAPLAGEIDPMRMRSIRRAARANHQRMPRARIQRGMRRVRKIFSGEEE
ncbi:MAG: hypothetical protein HY327_00785 [Chloroflexi bacterium]|nr:hypothetical protein [Chloroflexota bacterium]